MVVILGILRHARRALSPAPGPVPEWPGRQRVSIRQPEAAGPVTGRPGLPEQRPFLTRPMLVGLPLSPRGRKNYVLDSDCR